MKVITISGIIATWEMENESNVTPKTLKDSLNAAGGEDVRIDINSPGGSVYAGLEMFSAIRNYSGNTETRVVSLAASMGSIVALAGNKRTAEKTASYMIHNASGMAFGDHRAMAKMARELEAVSGHLSNIYTDRAGIDNKEVKGLMNEESWFYGSDLEDFGFEIVDAAEPVAIETAKFEAHARYNNFKSNLKPEQMADDLEKVAASIAAPKKNKVSNPTAIVGKNKNEEKLSVKTLDELKAQHLDLYTEAVNVGIAQGVAKSMDRVNAHITMGKASGALDLAIKNIEEGNEFDQTVSAQYMAEGLKNKDIQDRSDDDSGSDGLGGSGEDDLDDSEAQAAYTANLKNRFKGGK